MNIDMTVPCADGIINIRVGAIIMKNGKLLMVGGDGPDYLVSVGGRVKFGETAEEAIIREVEEETGVRLEIDRLVFVHENYYYGDVPAKQDKLVYELSFFFLMKVPDSFEPVSYSFAEGDSSEYLCWGVPIRTRKYTRQFSEHYPKECLTEFSILLQMKGKNKMCLICDRIEMIKDGTNPYFVKELETGYVVIGDNQHFHGYTLFLYKHHGDKTELFHLDPTERAKFLEEMTIVAEAVSRAFGAEKINYELLGMGDAHLHWHLFPRVSGDIGNYGNNGRGPVWWYPMEKMYSDDNKPSEEQLADMKSRLLKELEKLLAERF